MKLLIVALLLAMPLSVDAQTKTIYLVRHAKSSHDDPSLTDFDRPLAKRGNEDAPLIGRRLKEKGILPDLIISSPSKRTKQTAKHICEVIGYDYNNIQWNKSIYRCTSDTYISEIKKTKDSVNSLMIFGHNPATTFAANFLQSEKTIDNVPTTGVVCITFSTSSWANIKSENAKLKFFDYPKKEQ